MQLDTKDIRPNLSYSLTEIIWIIAKSCLLATFTVVMFALTQIIQVRDKYIKEISHNTNKMAVNVILLTYSYMIASEAREKS